MICCEQLLVICLLIRCLICGKLIFTHTTVGTRDTTCKGARKNICIVLIIRQFSLLVRTSNSACRHIRSNHQSLDDAVLLQHVPPFTDQWGILIVQFSFISTSDSTNILVTCNYTSTSTCGNDSRGNIASNDSTDINARIGRKLSSFDRSKNLACQCVYRLCSLGSFCISRCSDRTLIFTDDSTDILHIFWILGSQSASKLLHKYQSSALTF